MKSLAKAKGVRRRVKKLAGMMVAGGAIAWTHGAYAGSYTAADNLGSGFEPATFLGVLNSDNLYGGGWTIQSHDPIAGSATVLTNGTYTLTRVFDDGGPTRPAAIGLMDTPVLNTPTSSGPIFGDTDADNQVGLSDLNNVLNQFGATGLGLLGDIDHSGDITLTDLNAVLNNFGASGLSGISVDGPDDKTWHDGTTSYTVVAKHADLNSEFGYQVTTDPAFHTLLATSTVGTPSGTTDIGSASPFNWYIKAGGKTYFSDPSLNPQADDVVNGVDVRLDHMVTYQISGGSYTGKAAWLLWWEDLPVSAADQGLTDYQDALYEVDALGFHTGGGSPLVPLPASCWAGMSLLGLMAVVRLRRLGQVADRD